MTTNFTASNGFQIFVGTGYIKWSSLTNFNQSLEFAPTSVADEAFAEWYQHRRDTELGRWRDPENPDLVIYPNGDDAVCVFSESTGSCWDVLRSVATRERPAYSTWVESAARYFAANPEPKPWHSAEAGTFWRIHLDADDGLGRLTIAHGDNTFTDQYGIGWKAHDIHRADRLYPEESRDE